MEIKKQIVVALNFEEVKEAVTFSAMEEAGVGSATTSFDLTWGSEGEVTGAIVILNDYKKDAVPATYLSYDTDFRKMPITIQRALISIGKAIEGATKPFRTDKEIFDNVYHSRSINSTSLLYDAAKLAKLVSSDFDPDSLED